MPDILYSIQIQEALTDLAVNMEISAENMVRWIMRISWHLQIMCWLRKRILIRPGLA